MEQTGINWLLNKRWIYNITILYMLSELFWISLVTTSAGVIIKLASMCYKSRCKEVKLCGGRMSCVRDTEAEEKLDEFELTHPPPGKSPSSKNLGDLDNI
jgi:hypothetical protein